MKRPPQFACVSDSQLEDPFFCEFGNSITFTSQEECVADASQIKWHPESASFRQSNELQERYFLNLYLRWVFGKKPFKFGLPLKITRADMNSHPDFIISENGSICGLELSRATTSRYERGLNELIKKGSGFTMQIGTHLNGNDKNFNPKTHIHPIECQLFSEPIDLEQESEWARLTLNRILAKQEKFNKNYKRFYPACDLLLYSAWPVHDLSEALGFLRAKFSLLGSEIPSISFRRIAVLCESWAIFDPLGPVPQIFASNHFPLSNPKWINGSVDDL